MNIYLLAEKTLSRVCVSFAIACFAPLLQATILVSNMAEPLRDVTQIQQDPDLLAIPPIPLPWAAQSFNTDHHTYTLTSVVALLGGRVADPTVVAELRNDSGTQLPGALITTVSLGAVSTGATTPTTLTPVSAVNLVANTQYWLVLGALGGGSYKLEYAEGNQQTGVGSFGNYAYSDDRGANWTNFGIDNPYKLEVNVAPVPLSGVGACFALGSIGMAALRRRARAV